MQYSAEQFARLKIIPLMTEILTDVASSEPEHEKGNYLKKLLVLLPGKKAAQLLTPQEKERFREEYFPVIQNETRPFTGDTEQDERSRQLILETFMNQVQKRLQLSGASGLQAALFPSEERTFEADQVLMKNLYRLSWVMARELEQSEKTEKSEILQEEKNGATLLGGQSPKSAPASLTGTTQAMKTLEGAGFELVLLEPDENGNMRFEALDSENEEMEITVKKTAEQNGQETPAQFTFKFTGGKHAGKSFSMSRDEVNEAFNSAQTPTGTANAPALSGTQPAESARLAQSEQLEQPLVSLPSAPSASQVYEQRFPEAKTVVVPPAPVTVKAPPALPVMRPMPQQPASLPKAQGQPISTMIAKQSALPLTQRAQSLVKPSESLEQFSLPQNAKSPLQERGAFRLPEKVRIQDMPAGKTIMEKKREVMAKPRVSQKKTQKSFRDKMDQKAAAAKSQKYQSAGRKQQKIKEKDQKRKTRWKRAAAATATGMGTTALVGGAYWAGTSELAMQTGNTIALCIKAVCLG